MEVREPETLLSAMTSGFKSFEGLSFLGGTPSRGAQLNLIKLEVKTKMDLSNETIKELFYRQIRELTLRKTDTFDLQFSGKLLEK